MIIKTIHNRENPFVQINREALNDKKLSLKARGLWATCLSKPQDWHFHVSALVKELKEGKTAIYSALEELIEAGYCIRGQKREIEGGRFQSVEYIIYEFPATEDDKALLEDYFKNSLPHSGFPLPEDPLAENQPLLITDSKEKELEKKHICPNGGNALSSKENDLECDELGHAINHGVTLRGKAKSKHDSLSVEQKQAFRLIMNVPPSTDTDEYFNPVTALNLASTLSFDRIRKGIMVYKQRLERGERPKKMGAYLMKIFEAGYEPQPAHHKDNKEAWQRVKSKFPQGSYEENRDEVTMHFYPNRQLCFSMTPEVFHHQLRLSMEDLRNRE